MHTIPGAFEELTRLYAEGVAAVDEGRLEDAVELFTRGLTIDDRFRQQYVTMYAQRAFALQRLGRLAEALGDYAKAIEMEPPINQAQYWFHRGMCLAGLGDAERAVEEHARSIALYPQHPGPFHLRGKLLVEQLGRYEEGIADLDRLLAMREVPEGYQLRALAKVSLGRYAEAVPDAQRAEAMIPDAYNHYLLAVSHGPLGDEGATQHHVRAAIAGNPSFAEYFRSVPELEAFRGRPWFRELVE